MELEETNLPIDISYAVMRKKEVQVPMSSTLIAKHQQKDVKLHNK
jgi:hypothetical protein